MTILTRKWFSEKPIVTFTSGTVFMLDYYDYKSVWFHVLALSALTLKKANNQLPGSLSPDYK